VWDSIRRLWYKVKCWNTDYVIAIYGTIRGIQTTARTVNKNAKKRCSNKEEKRENINNSATSSSLTFCESCVQTDF
jgi:hypothetical protein